MRTITLELLRHGPAHNQLLSPLTPYLALCENHAAVTTHVPFEHNQMLFRLRALEYRQKEEARVFQLQDTARVLGELLAEIPGLTAESNKCDDVNRPLTHLRLILSASELALLPFELALSPNGLPGSGQPLLLQPQMPICLTREIRRVQDERLEWPRKPRILFAAAAPPDVGEIPLESHLLAMRRLVAPWVKYYDVDDHEMRRKRVEQHLVFLPWASIDEIERHCATGAFTHVHILAHGIKRDDEYDSRYYLALHDARDPEKTDYVSGPRLATALRASRRPDSNGLSRPAVATLASCDSGNVGSVAGAGASIAHALHEAGIPVVVAGQFPLSFGGSVRLVECLYNGLLWGIDPRPLLYDLRRQLYAQFPETHDWASLTAYVSLPPDFDKQLPEVRIDQAMHCINAAMNYADEATRRLFGRIGTKRSQAKHQHPDSPEKSKELLDRTRRKIDEAKKRLENLVECIPTKKARILGLLASTEKRQAEVLFSVTKSSYVDGATYDRALEESIVKLRKARGLYWDTFMLDPKKVWAVVQYISLALVLQRLHNASENESELSGNERPERRIEALWTMSHMLSTYYLRSKRSDQIAWACGNLIELYLLSLLMTPAPDVAPPAEAARRALEYTDLLIDTAGRDSFVVYSTRRQIFRYLGWYPEISSMYEASDLANRIFDRFPEEAEDRWQ